MRLVVWHIKRFNIGQHKCTQINSHSKPPAMLVAINFESNSKGGLVLKAFLRNS
jgi:hypothetical protein